MKSTSWGFHSRIGCLIPCDRHTLWSCLSQGEYETNSEHLKRKKYWHLINTIRQTNIAQVIFISDVCLGCLRNRKLQQFYAFCNTPLRVPSGIMHISYMHNMALFMETLAGACKKLFLYYYSNIKMIILCYLCKYLWENTLFFYKKQN